MGKTSLLREIATRASGFNVLEADGRESAYREPFDLLRQLGVHDDHSPAGIPRDPLAATQSLRDLVDTLSPIGPVLILVDDLQWADQESVESLYWLVHRAYGDRLLVVLGSRPESADSTDAWRRLMQQASRGPVLPLTGLSFEQATAAVLAVDPGADPDAIRRLWDHCARSPFHLDSLLRQYGFAELAAMRSLPAPATGRPHEIGAVRPTRLMSLPWSTHRRCWDTAGRPCPGWLRSARSMTRPVLAKPSWRRASWSRGCRT